jgi:hypothetical protein
MLDAISGAHIYGKNIVQSESFTQLRTTMLRNKDLTAEKTGIVSIQPRS